MPAASAPRATALIAVLTALAAGCGATEHLSDAECPPDGTELTYESFGRPFLDDYCQRCHARASENRNGAPTRTAFDTADDIVLWRERIYARSAASNISMPPGPDDPSAEERALLAEWLACGAP